MTWSLTPGQAADGPEGRRLIEAMGGPQEAGEVALLMDSAYEGDATRELAEQLGFVVVVPPNPQRKQPWALDKLRYRRRNEVERLFRRLKAWRRVFTVLVRRAPAATRSTMVPRRSPCWHAGDPGAT